jgi:hypothetical protein
VPFAGTTVLRLAIELWPSLAASGLCGCAEPAAGALARLWRHIRVPSRPALLNPPRPVLRTSKHS